MSDEESHFWMLLQYLFITNKSSTTIRNAITVFVNSVTNQKNRSFFVIKLELIGYKTLFEESFPVFKPFHYFLNRGAAKTLEPFSQHIVFND